MYYVAVDIGASSGRLMLSSDHKDRFLLKEVHRFDNGISFLDNHYRWDMNRLVKEILLGLTKIKNMGIDEITLGIDTWAVDYCVVDQNDRLKHLPVSYRDSRTKKIIDNFENIMSFDELYNRTGIQIQPFNTIFQLLSDDAIKPEDRLMLIPDYIAYVLTGIQVCEVTNASTTQLMNSHSRTWDAQLMEIVNATPSQFGRLVEPGTYIGEIDHKRHPGFNLPNVRVYAIATHDTASAIIGTPARNESWAYISSGTWSLLGIESRIPHISFDTFNSNYTNEFGVNNTVRFLKNIMGMWLIQEVSRELEYRYDYQEIVEMAKQSQCQSIIDVTNDCFLNPSSMIGSIKKYCLDTKQEVPDTIADFANVIYRSLARCYADELDVLGNITQHSIDTLHIIGGGSKNDYLNQLTANMTGLTVHAGPSEATAIGNIAVQMVATGHYESIKEVREMISKNIDIKIFKPKGAENEIG